MDSTSLVGRIFDGKLPLDSRSLLVLKEKEMRFDVEPLRKVAEHLCNGSSETMAHQVWDGVAQIRRSEMLLENCRALSLERSEKILELMAENGEFRALLWRFQNRAAKTAVQPYDPEYAQLMRELRQKLGMSE